MTLLVKGKAERRWCGVHATLNGSKCGKCTAERITRLKANLAVKRGGLEVKARCMICKEWFHPTLIDLVSMVKLKLCYCAPCVDRLAPKVSGGPN